MWVKAIGLRNFRLFKGDHIKEMGQGLNVILGENKDYDGSESNESGKSTVLEALLWCLSGDTKKGVSEDSLLFSSGSGETSPKMRVDILFGSESGDFMVSRTRKKKSSSSVLVYKQEGSGWVEQLFGKHKILSDSPLLQEVSESKVSGKKSQELFSKWLGIPEEVLKYVMYCRQGEGEYVFELPPKLRLEAFGSIFGFAAWDTLAESAQKMKQTLHVDVKDILDKIYYLKQRIMEEQDTYFGDDHSKLIEKVQETKEHLRRMEEEIKGRYRRIEENDKALDHNKLIVSNKLLLHNSIDSLQRQIKSIQRDMTSIKEDVVNTCHQFDIVPTSKDQVIGEIKSKISKIDADLEEIEPILDGLLTQLSEHSNLVSLHNSKHADLKILRAERDQLRMDVEDLTQKRDEMLGVNPPLTELGALDQELTKLKEDIIKLETESGLLVGQLNEKLDSYGFTGRVEYDVMDELERRDDFICSECKRPWDRDSVRKTVVELFGQVKRNRQSVDEMSNKKQVLARKVDQLREKVEELDLCGVQISRKTETLDLINERGKKLRDEVRKLEIQLESYDSASLQNHVSLANQKKQKLILQSSNLAQVEAKLSGSFDRRIKLKEHVDGLTQEIKDLEVKVSELGGLKPTLNEDVVKQLEIEKQNLDSQVNLVSDELSDMERDLATQDAAKARITVAQDSLKELEESEDYRKKKSKLDILTWMCGDRSQIGALRKCKILEIQTILPEIQGRVNNFLESIGAGQSIELDASEGTLNIWVSEGDVKREWHLWSGGGKKRIISAFYDAMWDDRLDFRLLDEPFSDVDEKGLVLLTQALKETDGQKILITHRDGVKQFADNVIIVKRDGGSSSFGSV